MSDNKKYYYIKLKDNYFEQDNIKIIEAQENGYIYSLIILKLYLKSAKHEGRLMMTDRIPYDPEKMDILAKVLNHDVAHIKESLKLAVDLDLITIMEGSEIWMNDIQNFIGQSSTEADRIRKYRKKLPTSKSVQMYDKCNNKSTPDETPYKSTPERELDLDKDIKKEKTKKPLFSPPPPDESIFDTPDYSDDITKVIQLWESLKLVKVRNALIPNFVNDGKILDSFKEYGYDKISLGITNYAFIINSSDHTTTAFTSLQNFLKSDDAVNLFSQTEIVMNMKKVNSFQQLQKDREDAEEADLLIHNRRAAGEDFLNV